MKDIETLGVTIGPNNFCVEADTAQIEQAERSFTDAAKEEEPLQVREKMLGTLICFLKASYMVPESLYR